MSTFIGDLSKMGYRELMMLRDVLDAYIENRMPDRISDDQLAFGFNANSGDVFLTNGNGDVIMLADGDLEEYLTLPYSGQQDFFANLLQEYSDLDKEDRNFLIAVAMEREPSDMQLMINTIVENHKKLDQDEIDFAIKMSQELGSTEELGSGQHTVRVLGFDSEIYVVQNNTLRSAYIGDLPLDGLGKGDLAKLSVGKDGYLASVEIKTPGRDKGVER